MRKDYSFAEPPFMTGSGRLVFRSVKWSECFAYILSPRGSFGVFEGEKLTLDELLGRYPGLSLDVMDEYFGVNRARFCGFASLGGECRELAVEIYHAGGLTYTADEGGEGS